MAGGTLPSAGTASRHDRYTSVAIALHWLIAAGIAILVAIGLTMVWGNLPQLRKFQLYQWHKSVGITVMLLVALRIVWRLTHRPPPLPAHMPAIEKRAANGAHLLLYALMIFMPLTGWAMVSASPYNIPTVLYGLIPWPHLPVLADLQDKAPVEAVFKLLHDNAAFLLILVIGGHAAAALRHHFLLGDTVLTRMAPWLRAKAKSVV